MGIREKLVAGVSTKKEQAEQEASSLKERLLKEGKEKEAEAMRAKIAVLNEKKAKLEAALSGLESSYSEVGKARLSLKTGRNEVAQKKAGKEGSKRKIAALLEVLTPKDGESDEDKMLREALQTRGLTTPEQIIAHPEFQDDSDVLAFKSGEVEVATAQEALKPKKRALVDRYLGEEVTGATEDGVSKNKNKRVGGARAARQAVKEAIPESLEGEELSLAGNNRRESVKKLRVSLDSMNEEIDALELKTPEGQAKLKKRFEMFYANCFADKKFFVGESWGVPRNFVDQVDISEANKYGLEVVKDAIKKQVQDKLTAEVEQAKSTVGLVKAKNDLEKIEGSEQKLGQFIEKVHDLNRKREEVVAALKAKEEQVGGQIRFYFGRESANGRGFDSLLKNDTARAWLYHLEKSSCNSLLAEDPYSKNGNHIMTGSIPTKMLEFLETKRKDSYGRIGPAERMFDFESFEKSLKVYEHFLNEVSNIIANQPEIIANGDISDVIVLNDKFRDVAKLTPYAGVRVESEQVMASLNAGRDLDQIKANIQKSEQPFDQARKERGAYLDNLVDKEWAEAEEKAFSNANPEIFSISQKGEVIRLQKEASLDLSSLVFKAKTSMNSGEFGSEESIGKFQVSLDPEGYPRVAHPEYEPLAREQEKAKKELELVNNKIVQNERTERPRKWFGKKPLDVELEQLKADQPIKVARSTEAEAKYKAIEKNRMAIYTAFSDLQKLLQKGDFKLDSKERTIPEFIDLLEKVINQASSATLSLDEQKVYNEYMRLHRKTIAATERSRATKGISQITINQLREMRYAIT